MPKCNILSQTLLHVLENFTDFNKANATDIVKNNITQNMV